jgi:hypothetical protein
MCKQLSCMRTLHGSDIKMGVHFLTDSTVVEVFIRA